MNISYIGNKTKMLPHIEHVLKLHHANPNKLFVDAFAGTSSVGKYFKSKGFPVYSNDIMHYSNVIGEALIENNSQPHFKRINKIINNKTKFNNIFDYFNHINLHHYKGAFFTHNYAPVGKCQRRYFTPANAKRIDFIRNTIDKWLNQHLITKAGFYYILTSLIYSTDAVSNCTGTWGAYLKHWDPAAKRPLQLHQFSVFNNHKHNKAFCTDAVKLVHKLHGEVLYIDTPYNNRDYGSNYHVLETLALNDNPKLHGKTGQRVHKEPVSAFSRKAHAESAMKKLLSNLDFHHVVVSYSTDGIIPFSDMVYIINHESYNNDAEIHMVKYREFHSRKDQKMHALYEILFYFEPNYYHQIHNEKR